MSHSELFELCGPIDPLDHNLQQLNRTTLQDCEPEPPPAFPINSPREGVDNVITHDDSATEQQSCPSDMNIDPEACRQAKMSLRELRFGSMLRLETAQLMNDEASIVSEECPFVGQR